MNSTLAKIHIAVKHLGFDDDRFKSLKLGVTGKESCKDMTASERQRVLDVLVKEGFSPDDITKKRKYAPLSPQQKKIWALWHTLADRGVCAAGIDPLNCFIERQTGVVRIEWLRHPALCRKVIEALKIWIEREVWRGE